MKEIKSIKSYNIKLEFDPETQEHDQQKLLETLVTFTEIWNDLSEYVYNNDNCTNAKVVHDNNYRKLRNKYKCAPAQMIIRAINDVIATYRTLKTNIKQGLIDAGSIKAPCFRKNLAMRLDKRICILRSDSIRMTVVNSLNKRVVCSFTPYEKMKEMMKYTACDPLIFYKDKTFWLSIPFEIPTPIHDENYCIGVDVGLKRFCVTSEGLMISGKELLKHKRKIRYKKRQIRKKIAENNKKNKSKKGSRSLRRKLKKFKTKEKNISNAYMHKYTNMILASTDANIIVLEDLSKIKKQNKKKSKKDPKYKYKYKGKRFNNRRSQIPWYLFKEMLTYKAPPLGKRVVTVNPYNTSRDDYRNAVSNKDVKEFAQGERKGCRYFAVDGKMFDADAQASVNIGLRWTRAGKHKLPVSFREPLDGGWNHTGRVLSTPLMFSEDGLDKPIGEAMSLYKLTTSVVGS